MQPTADRLGLVLFLIYVLLYSGFVVGMAVAPAWMSRAVPGGVNVAVIYGFGLIGIAFVLALIYGLLGRSAANRRSEKAKS